MFLFPKMLFWAFSIAFISICDGDGLEDLFRRMSNNQKSYTSGGNGPTFTRWGRADCPPTTEKIYDGYMAGPRHNLGGSGSNYLCLPKTPEWGDYTHYIEGNRGAIFGVELETEAAPFPSYLQNQDATCSVCQTINKKSVLMIPAKLTCPAGWDIEYNGYLVSQISQEGKMRSEYVCFDGSPIGVPGGESDNNNEALVYPVEVRCGSIKCSDYTSFRELTCVVCSR